MTGLASDDIIPISYQEYLENTDEDQNDIGVTIINQTSIYRAGYAKGFDRAVNFFIERDIISKSVFDECIESYLHHKSVF